MISEHDKDSVIKYTLQLININPYNLTEDKRIHTKFCLVTLYDMILLHVIILLLLIFILNLLC